MSLVALAATGAVVAPVAVRAQTATTPDVSIPEVRVIATTPASSTSPRRAAPAGITAPRPARAPAPVRGRVPPPAPVAVPAVIDPTVIDRDKVPSSTQSLTSADFTRTASPNVTETLFERVPSISISDPNGNGVQQAIQYRGFTASPTQGTPQGLAVYMGGIRLNEAFGDTVNFDLIPTNAIDRADVWSNNPLFGLNALGGAINLSMKNGFTYKGSEAEMIGGSFGRGVISTQTGWNNGNQSIYLAGQGFHDDGWRQQSDANVGRFFGDVGFRDDRTEVHGVLAAAKTSFGAIAATPVQMLARDWTSIFTNPQTTDNQMILAALNGKHALTDTWTLQGNVYARNFQQKHVDGNDGNFERCSNNGSVQFRNHLCLENDGFPAPNPVTVAFRDSFAILDQSNNPIPCPPGNGNTCAPVPYATIDRTQTRTTTVGGSFQATNAEKVFGHDNRFVVGTSVDYSQIKFNASSELGFIFPDLSVGINPNIPGMGSIIHTLGGFGYGPVGLNANTTYYGLFATDTFDITRELSATLGARLNVAKINMHDALGDSPELNTSPTYSRINPLAGLTYKYAPWLNFYGGYSESNRAPTPLELGCADRNNPCLIEGFLIADPPLKQVVGKTYEAGMRGIVDLNPGRFEWKLGVFRTDTFDDILQLASSIQGRGFFTNVQQIRRQGLEAAVEYRAGPWFAYAGYSFLDATYQFTGDLASPNNPMADDDGNVHVTPGKRVPMTPQHQFKAGADYMMTPQWTVGGTMVAVGPQVFDGDQANQNPKLPAYAVFNLRTTYQVDRNVQLFGLVNNLFNKKYLLFGSYFEPQGVQNAGLGIALTDQRTEVPGQPLSIYVGLRARL